MYAVYRRGCSISAGIVAVAVLAMAMVWGVPASQAIEKRYASIGVSDTDVPLALLGTFGPAACGADQHDIVWAGKGMEDAGGTRRLRLNIPGTPVAAYLYLVGTDDITRPGPHFPSGDHTVRAAILPEGGPRTVANVPVAYEALDVFVNKLDITAAVRQGINRIRVSGYDLNDPEGVLAVAVYTSPANAVARIDLFDGADFGYYPLAPPFGPDSEVVATTFPAEGIDRRGRVWMALGGMLPGRGDEVFVYTGAGDPVTDVPDTDGDLLPDVLQRQFPLQRVDVPPLRNDRADRAGHREALPGSRSLEEDRLGVPRSAGGYSRGGQLDMLARPFPIPLGHEYAAFQVQSEDPEFGDSFTLFLAATRVPDNGCSVNPAPEIQVTKAPKYTEGPPGLEVTFTFAVTAIGSQEPLRDVTVVDDPPMTILGPTGDDGDGLLSPTETWYYTATASFDAPGDYPDVVTASGVGDVSGLPVSDSDDALVRVVVPPGPAFHIVKTADPVLLRTGETITYTYTVCNDGDVTLDGVAVTDDRFPGETLGVVDDLVPGECDPSVTKVVAAPACATPGIGLQPGVCRGETARGTCFWPNVGTATWGTMTDDDDACVTIQEPKFHIVKTAAPTLLDVGDSITYTYAVCNDGDYALDGIVVTDDRFPGETLGVVDGLAPGECDGSVTKTVAAPACGTPGIGLQPGVCEGETAWGTCFWPNVGTATWEGRTDDDDACVTIREYGRIVVKKRTVGGDGTFEFTSDTLEPSPFTLTTAGGSAARDFPRLVPGAYDVAETPLAGWSLVGAGCTSSLGGEEDPAAIDLQPNETVTCTFVNATCAECVGKVTMLRLRFLGDRESRVRVTARADRFPDEVAFDGVVSPGGVFEVFGGYSPEEGFDGTLGTSVRVYVDESLDTEIHTSCSQPIGPGQVWGSFEVLYGESRGGGALCPLPPR